MHFNKCISTSAFQQVHFNKCISTSVFQQVYFNNCIKVDTKKEKITYYLTKEHMMHFFQNCRCLDQRLCFHRLSFTIFSSSNVPFDIVVYHEMRLSITKHGLQLFLPFLIDPLIVLSPTLLNHLNLGHNLCWQLEYLWRVYSLVLWLADMMFQLGRTHSVQLMMILSAVYIFCQLDISKNLPISRIICSIMF